MRISINRRQLFKGIMAAEGAITSVRMLGCSRGTSCDSGQFVLGQPENARNESLALRLPTAAELFPELVDPKTRSQGHSPVVQCSRGTGAARTLVNQTLAY